ncbi:MAG TPA: nucleotide exchange factor GrpE [Chloroflexi bacterium]|nr:nucleotide exchange factor GrpE [Chloroflexota bacterium]
MSDRRQIWETLSTLLAQLEQEVETALAQKAQPSAAVEALEQEIHKLGKVQFKTNALVESQDARWARWEEALAHIQEERQQRQQLVETIASERVTARERELLETILPALDGLENAIASGKKYLQVRDKAAQSPHLTPAQATLVSPADRAKLAGWLEGLRLVRQRLLAVLEAGGVTPIPTVGHPFDPYLHVAVGATQQGTGAPGAIVAEERRGYQSSNGVLRYAEVIVYRPSQD